MQIVANNLSKKYFLEKIQIDIFEFEEFSTNNNFFKGVFRRHHTWQDPVNFNDPEGKNPLITGAIGAVIGAIAGGYNSNSCTIGGQALDVAIGAGSGFAAGAIAGFGVGGSSFVGYFFGTIGGIGLGAGSTFHDLFVPSGDQLLGNACSPKKDPVAKPEEPCPN